MAQTSYLNRFASRAEKKARREAVEAQFDEGSTRDAKSWDEGFMEAGTVRPLFNPVSGPMLSVLDGLLDSQRLCDILGTLAQLCEARAPSEFDMDTDFSDHDESELWQERANALYKAMERIK